LIKDISSAVIYVLALNLFFRDFDLKLRNSQIKLVQMMSYWGCRAQDWGGVKLLLQKKKALSDEESKSLQTDAEVLLMTFHIKQRNCSNWQLSQI